MNIEFKRIEMQNFMSFAEEAFDFSSCNGMNLVQGKNNDIPNARNGTGKSQTFLSLLYVLFGQLQSKIKNENIVNKYSSSNDMALALDFAVDGQQYKIRRGISKGKASFLELFRIDNGEEVDITKSTIPETQAYIEKELLHCDVTIFLRTILLTADQTYNFYMLKKADKKDFVEKLFDISVFEEMYRAMHKDCLILEKSSIACQNKLLVLNKNLEDYESRKLKSDEAKEASLASATEAVEKTKAKLEEAKKTEVKSDSTALSKLQDAINALQESQDAKQDELKSLQAKESQIDLGMHKLDETKASKQSIVDKHKDVLQKLCDDCKPIFMKHYNLDKILDEISSIDKKKEVLCKSKAEVHAKASNALVESKSFKDKLAKARDKMKLLVEESTKAAKVVSMLEAKLQEAMNTLKSVANSVNPYDDLVAACKKDIDEELAKSKKIEESLKYLKFAESIVSQDTLRKFIIKDLVVLLNNKIKTYLTKLGAKYYVEFDEDMDYEFITPGGSCEWSNFSAGERMRIMIATSFAFRDFMSIRNGLNANILVLDEYFDSAIDTLCVESVLDILKGYSTSQKQNIFVISHRPEVSPELFDRVITVEKTNGIAQLKTA